jgi:transposase
LASAASFRLARLDPGKRSRTSVHNYLKRAQQAGLRWPLPTDLDEAAIEARLFQCSEEANRSGHPEPDWLEVHREHKRGKHVTLQLLHLEYKADHPDGWGYTQFCTHYRRWLGRQDVVMRLEYAAGERMFVDFAGDTVPVTDPETGEVWQAQVFVSVLGASGYLYVEATRSQDLAAWLGATSAPWSSTRARRRSSCPTTSRRVSPEPAGTSRS